MRIAKHDRRIKTDHALFTVERRKKFDRRITAKEKDKHKARLTIGIVLIMILFFFLSSFITGFFIIDNFHHEQQIEEFETK